MLAVAIPLAFAVFAGAAIHQNWISGDEPAGVEISSTARMAANCLSGYESDVLAEFDSGHERGQCFDGAGYEDDGIAERKGVVDSFFAMDAGHTR